MSGHLRRRAVLRGIDHTRLSQAGESARKANESRKRARIFAEMATRQEDEASVFDAVANDLPRELLSTAKRLRKASKVRLDTAKRFRDKSRAAQLEATSLEQAAVDLYQQVRPGDDAIKSFLAALLSGVSA